MQPLGALVDHLAERLRHGDQTFRQMAALAKLDPERDFVGADLAHVNFRDEDLAGFNFSFADVSHCDFTGADLIGCSFHGALQRGTVGLPPALAEVSVDELEALLQDQEEDVRAAAIGLAASLAPSDTVARLLLRSTRDASSRLRARSYEALASLAVHLPHLKDEVRNGFKDKNSEVRATAVAAFGGDLRQTFRDALLQQHADVRRASALQLGTAHAGDPQLVERLMDAAKDSFWFVRRNVCEAIRSLDYNPILIGVLATLIDDREAQVQMAAANALVVFEDQTHSRRPLIKALQHRNPEVRAVAVTTLAEHFGDPEVAAHFTNPLADPDSRVRAAALSAFVRRQRQ